MSVLSSCQKTATSLPEKVEIGALLSLTGNWSSLGITSQEAINLAVSDVNAFMQQKGNSLRFSATTFENKLDAALAKEAINSGLNKKIKYFIGPQSSAELAMVKPIADANTALNAAGDRSIGVFDYWGISFEAGKYKWIFKGKSS